MEMARTPLPLAAPFAISLLLLDENTESRVGQIGTEANSNWQLEKPYR
jgi:hypothetical protein